MVIENNKKMTPSIQDKFDRVMVDMMVGDGESKGRSKSVTGLTPNTSQQSLPSSATPREITNVNATAQQTAKNTTQPAATVQTPKTPDSSPMPPSQKHQLVDMMGAMVLNNDG